MHVRVIVPCGQTAVVRVTLPVLLHGKFPLCKSMSADTAGLPGRTCPLPGEFFSSGLCLVAHAGLVPIWRLAFWILAGLGPF